jgi:hypothetical protein
MIDFMVDEIRNNPSIVSLFLEEDAIQTKYAEMIASRRSASQALSSANQ